MSYSQQDYSNLRKIVSGDIIVKCRYGNDIRRIPINQAPSYDELCLMMYRLFKSELSNPENIVLKYTDDEGDLVSMTDDTDVNHAISQSSLLKITVFDKQKHPFLGTASSSTPAYAELKDQMSQLRDMIDHVLDSLTQASKSNAGPNGATTGDAAEKTYRNLSTAELAQFLDDGKKDQKKTEMQDHKEPQQQAIPSYPPPPAPVSVPTPSQAPAPYPPPPSSTPTAAMPRPPLQQQQQQQQQQPTMQQPYPPAQPSPVNGAPAYPPPPRPASIPPQPGTPQTPTSYPPERPSLNDFNGYRVSAPSAPPSTQYYYPPPPQQQAQRPPVNTAGWR